MRFLIDRCAGRRLASWLTDAGHDVVDSSQWDRDPGDIELLRQAHTESRVLVTIDQDFGVLIFVQELPHCGMVRLPDCPPSERIEILRDLLNRHTADLEARAIITVRGGKIRISRLS